MTWYDIIKIFLTAIAAALFSNVFSYWRDRQISKSKYKEEILNKIYLPIYKITTRDDYTGKGYDGLNTNEIFEIHDIINKNLEYCDPKLQTIVNNMFETARQIDGMREMNLIDNIPSKLDADMQLYYCVRRSYNEVRRNLGLPHEKMDYIILIHILKIVIWRIKK